MTTDSDAVAIDMGDVLRKTCMAESVVTNEPVNTKNDKSDPSAATLSDCGSVAPSNVSTDDFFAMVPKLNAIA
jgi:hypothetical protein